MNTADRLHHRAAELVEAARAFHAGADQRGSHVTVPDSLAALEEALQVLSAAWYQLAADASPGIAERQRGRASGAPSWPEVDGLSREQEVRLMATLHDIAAAFARCARECREGRATVTPSLARRWPPEKLTISAVATSSRGSRAANGQPSASHDRFHRPVCRPSPITAAVPPKGPARRLSGR